MKAKVVIAILVLVAITALGRMVSLFSNWGNVENESSSIFVARCGKPTPPPPPSILYSSPPRSDSEIEIIAILKGTNSPGMARLQTDHELHQGENYLVFGKLEDGNYKAFEQYKVVPIGSRFSTNWIAGKNLDEQIQVLFKHALFQLDREIKEDQEQKAQLETAVGGH